MSILCCLLTLSSEGNFTAINSFQSYEGICWESDWFTMYFGVFLKECKSTLCSLNRTLHWLTRKMYKNGIYWLSLPNKCVHLTIPHSCEKQTYSNHVTHCFLCGITLCITSHCSSAQRECLTCPQFCNWEAMERWNILGFATLIFH